MSYGPSSWEKSVPPSRRSAAPDTGTQLMVTDLEELLAAAEQRGYERAKKDAVDLCRELADEGVTNLYEYSAAIGKLGG